MFRHLELFIKESLGTGIVLWVVPILLVGAFLLATNRRWRQIVEADHAGDGTGAFWRILLSHFVLLILTTTCLGILSASLHIQSGLFSESHGNVTARNYEAVRTKWGIPHEQHDLTVTHHVLQTKVVEFLANGESRETLLEEREPPKGDEEEIVVSDETVAALKPEDLAKNPAAVVRRVRKKVRQEVRQDSIPSAIVTISLKSNPRQLGGAVYAGYDDTWSLRYRVENRSDVATQAVFRFPIPGGGHGIYDRLTIAVDGQDYYPKTSQRDAGLEWRAVMPPASHRTVEIGYRSRGLEHFRYRPGNMREECRVTVHLDGVDDQRLNFPIGSMPPMEDLKTLSGDKHTLHWDLSRAVTNLDIGVMMPVEEQPGYHIGRILRSAPIGLLIMTTLIIVTRILLGKPFRIVPILLTGVAYYLSCALPANFNDIMPFAIGFWLGTVPIAFFVALFWFQQDGRQFVACQTSLLFAIFAVGYPHAVLAGDVGGTILHVGYAVLTIYVMILVARRSRVPTNG